MQVPFYPPIQKLQDFTEARCESLIDIASGLNSQVQVKTVRAWTMSAQVAQSFRVGLAANSHIGLATKLLYLLLQ